MKNNYNVNLCTEYSYTGKYIGKLRYGDADHAYTVCYECDDLRTLYLWMYRVYRFSLRLRKECFTNGFYSRVVIHPIGQLLHDPLRISYRARTMNHNERTQIWGNICKHSRTYIDLD